MADLMEVKKTGKKRRKEGVVNSEQPPAEAMNGASSNVMYIGQIPHGFYEREIAGFFSQFGTLEKVKVARNGTSGRSKGFAFVQFKHADVAKIAADSMDGYLLLEKKISCRVCSTDWVKERPALFRGWNTPIDPKKQLIRKIESVNRPLSEEQYFETLQKHVTADDKLKARIQQESIDYDCAPFVSLIPKDSGYHSWVKKRKREADAAEAAAVEDSHSLESQKQKNKLKGKSTQASNSSSDDEEGEDEDILEEIESDSEPEVVEKGVEDASDSELDHSPSLSLCAWIDGDTNEDDKGSQQESKAEQSSEKKAQPVIDLSPPKAKKPKKSSSPSSRKRSKSK